MNSIFYSKISSTLDSIKVAEPFKTVKKGGQKKSKQVVDFFQEI